MSSLEKTVVFFFAQSCDKSEAVTTPTNTRPLSAPFLFRTSGKGTDMATPLGPEKYGRIDFSLERWTTIGQNAPKMELKHAKEQVELVRIFLRSLLRPQESLF